MLILIGGLKFMDMKKFSELLIQCEDLKDIPAIVVFRVAISVIEIINSGECMKELDSCM